jgi:hypothetical protein
MTFAISLRLVCIMPPTWVQPAKTFALPGDGWYSIETRPQTLNPDPENMNHEL